MTELQDHKSLRDKKLVVNFFYIHPPWRQLLVLNKGWHLKKIRVAWVNFIAPLLPIFSRLFYFILWLFWPKKKFETEPELRHYQKWAKIASKVGQNQPRIKQKWSKSEANVKQKWSSSEGKMKQKWSKSEAQVKLKWS